MRRLVTSPSIGRRAVLGIVASLALTGFRPGKSRSARANAQARGNDLIGQFGHYVTREEDTLLDVAQRHDLGILELSAVNPGVDAWVPGRDRTILLPTAHLLPDGPRQGILVNKAELRLYWFTPAGVETHAIGVGREGLETPIGQTRIVRKAKDPIWRPTADARRARPELGAVVLPGPDNPMGSHALYLGWPTYAIHGTHKPYSIGRRLSRGCMRLYPRMIARLYERVPIGTVVTVVDQPVKVGWHRGELYLEVHPDLGQLDELEDTYDFTLKPGHVLPAAIELVRRKAGSDGQRVDWRLVEAELIARRGVPVQITNTPERAPLTAALSPDGGARGSGGASGTQAGQSSPVTSGDALDGSSSIELGSVRSSSSGANAAGIDTAADLVSGRPLLNPTGLY